MAAINDNNKNYSYYFYLNSISMCLWKHTAFSYSELLSSGFFWDLVDVEVMFSVRFFLWELVATLSAGSEGFWNGPLKQFLCVCCLDWVLRIILILLGAVIPNLFRVATFLWFLQPLHPQLPKMWLPLSLQLRCREERHAEVVLSGTSMCLRGVLPPRVMKICFAGVTLASLSSSPSLSFSISLWFIFFYHVGCFDFVSSAWGRTARYCMRRELS